MNYIYEESRSQDIIEVELKLTAYWNGERFIWGSLTYAASLYFGLMHGNNKIVSWVWVWHAETVEHCTIDPL